MLSGFEGRRIIFLDGASGTMLQKYGLEAGQRPDMMNITAPEAVESVQRAYFEAGSEIIYANTFGANTLALHGTGFSPERVISAAVAITLRVCGGRAKTALDIGSLGVMLDPLGDMPAERAYELFREQAVAGERAGAELAAIETMSDITELRAAILAVTENTKLPVLASMTFDKTGHTFTGCTPEDFAVMAESLGVAALGLNCSFEPSAMLPTVRRLAEATALPLIIKPNAGLPDSATGSYSLTPAEFADQMAELIGIGENVKLIGGCCGTTPDYIRELRRAFENI